MILCTYNIHNKQSGNIYVSRMYIQNKEKDAETRNPEIQRVTVASVHTTTAAEAVQSAVHQNQTSESFHRSLAA